MSAGRLLFPNNFIYQVYFVVVIYFTKETFRVCRKILGGNYLITSTLL